MRYVLHMPILEDESLVKVQLEIGKTIETTDSRNRFFFTGKLEEENIQVCEGDASISSRN